LFDYCVTIVIVVHCLSLLFIVLKNFKPKTSQTFY